MGLRIESLSAGYSDTIVIDGLSVSIASGEAVAIIGRNGVGKSTLLASIMGVTTHHAGTILFEEKSLTGLAPYQRARAGIGYVPQEREVFPSLSVTENLAIAGRPGHWTLDAVFELFPSLHQRRTNFGNQLSGGEQQMLAIARALVGNPRLLLMDEPSEGLAPVIVEQLQVAISRLRDEFDMSIVLVEQNSRVALGFAERCLVMNRGQIVRDGPSAELRDDDHLLQQLIGVEAS